MTYRECILTLKAENKRATFNSRFEDLFSEEEWLSMSLTERQKAERAFRHEAKNIDDVGTSFSSIRDTQVKLYNVVCSYNGTKRNFK